MKVRLFVLLFLSFSCFASAQSRADSIALVDGRWSEIVVEKGLLCKKLNASVFGVEQEIFYTKIDPLVYRAQLVQGKNKQVVRELARDAGARVAVNGGFFVTTLSDRSAVANDFMKIGSRVYNPQPSGWGDAALGIDSSGRFHFAPWIVHTAQAVGDSAWYARYPMVIVAGPMLVANSRSLPFSPLDNKRHPRTVAGTDDRSQLIIITVMGRLTGAKGMTISELSYLARVLGAVDAINLDGGGSTSLVLDGKYLNRHIDQVLGIHVPRAVANAVVFVRR